MNHRRRLALFSAALAAGARFVSAAPPVVLADPILTRLAARSFNDPVYAQPFFKSLSAPRENAFADEIGWKAQTPFELAVLSDRFPVPAPLKGKARLELRTFVSAQESAPHMILLGVLEKTDVDRTPLGSFSAAIRRAKSGELESHIGSVYFDRADARLSGIAPAVLSFLKKEVYPVVGVTQETLKADHAGRYVWAKQGFQFDPTYWYKDDNGKGDLLRLHELARRNFARFLRLHRLKVEDLALRGRPLSSLDQLQTPDDFASVVHRGGKKLTIEPYVLGVLEPATAMDIGKAFMLTDYRPHEGPYVLSKARTMFSTTAMPYWNGWRKP